MKDEEIIKLFFERDENAIAKTKEKYGDYCKKISMNILGDPFDSEECVSDALLGAWKSIPPKQPTNLATYLGKLVRNFSINRYNMKQADKRSASQLAVSLDELSECVSVSVDIIERNDQVKALGACISGFLRGQKELARKVFVCRYFYCESIAEIAERFQVSEGRVKSILFRMRGKLKKYLEDEGFHV